MPTYHISKFVDQVQQHDQASSAAPTAVYVCDIEMRHG